MRILYLILFLPLKYSFRLFFSAIKTVNSRRKFLGRTIYVSNHPASFFDPLVIAGLQLPIVFFMTRADIFTKISKPFFWAFHMLPIYRQQDGGDTVAKNEKIFRKCSRILSQGRNLLIFGEGFTDDVFIRRLKPIKKGAVKIGFSTLENMNWKKNVYMAAIGCNYTNPLKMRSKILISNSERICLNHWKETYLENPTKAITDVTKILEKMMREQLTHVEKKDDAPFHENMMIITRKGMNNESYDSSLTMKQRWNYSRKLALWLNKQDIENDENLSKLKSNTEDYFSLLKKLKLEDQYVSWKKDNPKGGRAKELLVLILLFPLMILGTVHCIIPYKLAKNFTEKSFKRSVFWSSVKLILGMFAIGIFNIPFIFLFYYFVYSSFGLAFLYYVLIALFGLLAYIWFSALKSFKTKRVIKKTDLSKLIAKRDDLESRILDLTETSS
ncbi:MAG: 1-acyl-sn-glycerol-3-phosphate acyltransferase [Crocinitomicaceae bacterium]|nr:1-acyl-sn-glycerol-3-phosphate acyltransferase [Crocinitomicaceae bacterium]